MKTIIQAFTDVISKTDKSVPQKTMLINRNYQENIRSVKLISKISPEIDHTDTGLKEHFFAIFKEWLNFRYIEL